MQRNARPLRAYFFGASDVGDGRKLRKQTCTQRLKRAPDRLSWCKQRSNQNESDVLRYDIIIAYGCMYYRLPFVTLIHNVWCLMVLTERLDQGLGSCNVSVSQRVHDVSISSRSRLGQNAQRLCLGLGLKGLVPIQVKCIRLLAESCDPLSPI